MTTLLRSTLAIQTTLSPYHPLLIEGHTKDARDPAHVASRIVASLRRSWKERNVTKPPLLITQVRSIRMAAHAESPHLCLLCIFD